MTEVDSKASALAQGRPIHILRPTQDRITFEVVPDALAQLQAIKGPVTTVAIIGNQRGGKSTLMNLLHSRSTSGFQVGHYMDPQTTGIWLRARPHPRNKELTVLMVDTEGLDSPGVRQDYNWVLSAFVLLICNTFVYQTISSIDASAIERLGVILRVAEQLRGGASSSSSAPPTPQTPHHGGSPPPTPSKDKSDKGKDLPTFMWLLRDHHLKMQQSTPKDEMLDKLDKPAIQALQRFFKSWDCYPLPRPLDNEQDLGQIEKMDFDHLASKFKEEYVIFERFLYSTVERPFQLSGQQITGELLGNLFVKYTQAVTSKVGILTELSQLPTQQQMIIQLAGERAIREGLQAYKDGIQHVFDKMPLAEEALTAAHDKARAEALRLFSEEAAMMGGSTTGADDMSLYRSQLEEKIAFYKPIVRVASFLDSSPSTGPSSSATANGVSVASAPAFKCVAVQELVSGHYHSVWTANASASQHACTAALTKLTVELHVRVEGKTNRRAKADEAEAAAIERIASVPEYDEALAELVGSYRAAKEAVGVAKDSVLTAYLQGEARLDRETVRISSLRAEFSQQMQEQAAALQQSFKSLLTAESQELRGLVETQAQSLAEAQTANAKRAEELALAAERGDRDVRQELEAALGRLGERVNGCEVGLASAAEATSALKSRLDSVESRVNSLESSTRALADDLRAQLTQTDHRADERIAAVRTAMEGAVGELRRENKDGAKDAQDLLRALQEKMERQVENVTEKIGGAHQNLSALTATLSTLQASMSEVRHEQQNAVRDATDHAQRALAAAQEKTDRSIEELSGKLQSNSSSNAESIQSVSDQLSESLRESSATLKQDVDHRLQMLRESLSKDISVAQSDSTMRTTHLGELVHKLEENVDQFKDGITKVTSGIDKANAYVQGQTQAVAQHIVDQAMEKCSASLVTLEDRLNEITDISKSLAERIEDLTRARSNLESDIKSESKNHEQQFAHVQQSCDASFKLIGDVRKFVEDLSNRFEAKFPRKK